MVEHNKNNRLLGKSWKNTCTGQIKIRKTLPSSFHYFRNRWILNISSLVAVNYFVQDTKFSIY